MACIGSQVTDSQPVYFPRTRRHALVPPNCCHSAKGTEESSGPKTPQPLAPTPDSLVFQNIRFASPPRSDPTVNSPTSSVFEDRVSREPSPTSSSDHERSGTPRSLFKARARDPQRLAINRAKAQAHYARDRQFDQPVRPTVEEMEEILGANFGKRTPSDEVGSPKAKARPLSLDLVRDEELGLRSADRCDTPHISEELDSGFEDNQNPPPLISWPPALDDEYWIYEGNTYFSSKVFSEVRTLQPPLHHPSGIGGTDTPHISEVLAGDDLM